MYDQSDIKPLISKVNTVENYPNSEKYKLECGAVVQWKYDNLINGYELYCVKEPSYKVGCGNPFNMMNKNEYNHIKKFIINNIKEIPCDTSCSISINIYHSDEQLKSQIQNIIGADCWGVYSTTKDHKEHKIYFSHRETGICLCNDNPRDCYIRNYLIENPIVLIDEIKLGKTVGIVLGGNDFLEIYYHQLADNSYQEIINRHYR